MPEVGAVPKQETPGRAPDRSSQASPPPSPRITKDKLIEVMATLIRDEDGPIE